MLKVNQNLQEAVLTFNKFTIPRAEIVMDRIFKKPGASYKELFSIDEMAKFNKAMSISEAQLNNIVSAFNFVLMHAVAERNIPQIEQALKESGLSNEHYQVFMTMWLQYGNEYSLKIREKPVAVREVLHQFNWTMSLQIEESRLPLIDAANFMNVTGKIDNCDDLYSYDARNPVVNFIFQTKQSDDKEGKSIEKFGIKFQKAQLQELFEHFENIQDAVDKLM